ncbi:MAG: protein phosphatase 2C domain-containing protein [Pseudomonadota bacterium]
MMQVNEVRYEAATGLSLGARKTQEDSVLCDVPQGGGAGILVLADGLGGHAGGALASRVAVTTALRELAGHRDGMGRLHGDIPHLLQNAVEAANHAVLAQVDDDPDLRGMGTTLVAAIVQGRQLHWISVGDSPLWLIRDGRPIKLNETHSLAPHLDLLVEVGEMTKEDAADHPGRNCLTSALGTDEIERVDCPDTPRELTPGDTLLAASDGILTLALEDIAGILSHAPPGASTAHCVERLLEAVALAGHEEQDNTSLALLRIAPVARGGTRRGVQALLSRIRESLRLESAAARIGFDAVRAGAD